MTIDPMHVWIGLELNECGFYFSMTHQDWYDSFTLQEESDYPGTVIYYLMRDEADGG